MDVEEIKLMKTTPSSALGSCRIKIKPEHYDQIISFLQAKEIGMFFYTGGNDSMDTVAQLSKYAKEQKIEGIQFIGVPKTIDNDLFEIDHTPGFGSCSKFVVSTISEMNRDAIVYDKKTVTIIEVMGRDTGWIAASTGLAADEHSCPDLIYTPERGFSLEKFEADVKKTFETKDSCLVIVSEGVKLPNGEFVADTGNAVVDSFGHKKMGGAHQVLNDYISNKLDVTVRSTEFGIQQRCSITHASATDIEEAYTLGKKALEYALEGQTGVMSSIKRVEGSDYAVKYEAVDVQKVANNVKYVPEDFFLDGGYKLSQKGIEYFRPLIQGDVVVPKVNGVPRFSTLSPKTKGRFIK